MKTLKDDRSIIKVLLLDIITFGIYEFLFIHKLSKDINKLCLYDEDELSGIGTYILYSVFTLGIYQIFYWRRAGDMLAREIRRKNLYSDISGGFIMLCFILQYFSFRIAPIIGFKKIIDATNELATEYNRNLKYTSQYSD